MVAPSFGVNAGTVPPPVVEVYDIWCQWLDIPEDTFPLHQVMQMLLQGGETFRSFLQFMARQSEPHLGLAEAGTEGFEDEALRRSCMAMQVTVNALVGPAGISSGGGSCVLAAVCYELLGGLQPRSRGCSMHICTVLQHLLFSDYEAEVCGLLMQYHAPFVLLRALDRPGCPELLRGLLFSCDAALPHLLPCRVFRPLCPQLMHQVVQYLLTQGWPQLVAALIEQGVKLNITIGALPSNGNGSGQCNGLSIQGGCSTPVSAASKPPRPVSPLQRTPNRRTSLPSPATEGWSTPGLAPGTPHMISPPGSTPSRFSTSATLKAEASPLRSLMAPPSSPSPSEAPCFIELPAFPLASTLATLLEEESDHRALRASCRGVRCRQDADVVHLVQSGQGGGSSGSSSKAKSPSHLADAGKSARRTELGTSSHSQLFEEPEGSEGVGLLLEFLTSTLEMCGRSSAATHRAKQPDLQGELRAQARWKLLQHIFVETTLISHLFKLLRHGAVQLEAAALLNALLQHALEPQKCHVDLASLVAGLCLPHLESLGQLLQRGAPRAGRAARRRSDECDGSSRRSACTAEEPLGVLRVAAVKILAALCELAPERVLPLVKPSVWSLTVEWFLGYRCNHIFQAACGRIWISIINHGGSRLQHLVLVRLRLLNGLCDSVLAEGACGDRWQELKAVPRCGDLTGATRVEKAQVAVRKARHPGGLGGIAPVIWALAAKAAAAARQQDHHAEAHFVPAVERPALAERYLQQATLPAEALKRLPVAQKKVSVASSQSIGYLPQLLESTSLWPQVLEAAGTPPTAPDLASFAPRPQNSILQEEAAVLAKSFV